MNAVGWTTLASTLALLLFTVLLLRTCHKRMDESVTQAKDFVHRVIVARQYIKANPRCEVEFLDWGPEFETQGMRWRWVIWPADQVVDKILTDPIDHDDEDKEVVDNRQPLMLGNAPTRDEAEVQVLAWLSANGHDRWVVSA